MENESTDDSAVQDKKSNLDETDAAEDFDTKPIPDFEKDHNKSERPILENGVSKEEVSDEEEENNIKSEESFENDEVKLEETAEESKSAYKREAESEEESVPRKKLKKSEPLANGDVNEPHYDEPEDEIESESDEEVCKLYTYS